MLILHEFKMEGATKLGAGGQPDEVYHYVGKRVRLSGQIEDVRYAGTSPSISLENSVVHFRLLHGRTFPSLPKCDVVELRFNEHSLPVPFIKGDVWDITLTERGDLVSFKKVKNSTKETAKEKGEVPKGDKSN
jgi:hypothetical protein